MDSDQKVVKIISVIKWIRTSKLSIQNSLFEELFGTHLRSTPASLAPVGKMPSSRWRLEAYSIKKKKEAGSYLGRACYADLGQLGQDEPASG